MATNDFDFEGLLDVSSFQADRIEPPGPWVGHIPFAAWIMRTVRPKLFVELGTHSGNSYLAFCQAAKEAQLPVKCYAVDTWRGDEHSGPYDDSVYAKLSDYNQSRYGGFSTLLRTTFDDAVGYFSDGSIELLHIDGMHTYEAVRHDFETWKPKLASGAFVIFHDTNVREREFGVWKFWEELQKRFPWNLDFAHCNGLGVLSIRDEPPELEWLQPDSPLRTVLPRYFASLGARFEDGDRYRAQIDAACAARSDMESRHQAEVRSLNDAVAAHGAEIRRLNDAESAIRQIDEALAARDRELSAVKAERDVQIAWRNDERTRLTEQVNDFAARLNLLQDRFDKLTRSFTWRLADRLVHLPRSAGRAVRWPIRRIAFHKNGRPRGWLRRLTFHFGDTQSAGKGLGKASDAQMHSGAHNTMPDSHVPAAGVALDAGKPTILVVAHEATRSGAPILALNLIQRLSDSYNVVSLILGGGELTDHFRRASAGLFVADARHMTDEELNHIVKDIAGRYSLKFAIVNSVASRRALLPLKTEGVPTVSLVHEFSSNMRPRSVVHEIITLSTETVFSTKVTLASAASDHWLYSGTSIHVAPQGKCIVPVVPGDSDALIEKAWLTANLRPQGVGSKFLVIGVGNIELRKGVDLFIECATILKSQPGGEKFQFVWIGNGFDPEYFDPQYGPSYSVYLDDQIKRAEIELQLKIIRSTSQIELAYQIADLLVISSRLDPLPNVAIDALLAGRPVLCFEKTTGVADFLIENGLGDQCVANFLDTNDLARKVKALANSDDLRAHVSERARAAAEKEFDMKMYVSRIEAIAQQAVGNEARVEREVETILTSGKFRSDFFKHASVESLAEEKIVQDYLHRMACGLGVRKPMPGFHPTLYASLQQSEGQASADPFVDFLQKGLPEGPWLQRVIQNGEGRRATPRAARVALHLHAFYADQLPGIINRLNLNASVPDLFISVVTPESAEQAREAASAYRGRLVDLQITPNMGRDIGPFLTQFGRALCEGYDIVGHLHTKKSAHLTDRGWAEAWNTFLLENLIGGERGGAMLDEILSVMQLDPAVGIVFPDDPHVIGWTKNRKYADALAARMKCGELPEHFNFPVGSMFWMQALVLAKFAELELQWCDYAPEPLPIDGTIVHAIERLFGVAPASLGMTCAVTNVRGLNSVTCGRASIDR